MNIAHEYDTDMATKTSQPKVIGFQAEPQLQKVIDAFAERTGFSRSVAIRLLVAHGLKHLKSLRVGP